MERVQAVLGGIIAVVVIFGGFMAIRTITRLFWATVRLAETVALFGLAIVIGYVIYRILWGPSDDPRYH